MTREFHYTWEWQLRSTPEQSWPYVSDTQRFNRVTVGYAVNAADQAGTDVRRLRARRLMVPLEWDEYPFEWERPLRFSVVRRFHGYFVRDFIVRCTLAPHHDGTLLRYEVTATPATVLGWLAIPIQIGLLSHRQFARAFRRVDDYLQRPTPHNEPYASGQTFVTGEAAQRTQNIARELERDGYSADLVDRLIDFITTAEDDDVAHIRAYALADRWHAPRRQVLELCLAATRRSLLDLRWDVLCPMCRGVKATASQLSDIHDEAHCPACNLNFQVNFDRALEVTFRPNGAIRKVEVLEYCVGGPQLTPHVLAQQKLAPYETRDIDVIFGPGAQRVRTRSKYPNAIPGHLDLRASVEAVDQPAQHITVIATQNGWTADQLIIEPQAAITIENRTAHDQSIVLERVAWNDQATTAADVSTLQAFRDWFAAQALRPDVQLGITHLAVLFTDLRGSTQLYRMIGDAPAFGRVLAHFDVLRRSVDHHEGALIKTIGDAIMAAFLDPASGVRAGLDILRGIAELNATRSDYPLRLKLGLHAGPAIAVTLNDRLDYFGTTVNIASRLEGQAQGDDLIVSAEVMGEAAVQRALADNEVVIEKFRTQLRGFVDEEFELYRIRLSTP